MSCLGWTGILWKCCQLEIFCFRAITTVENMLEECDQMPPPPPRSHPLVPLRRVGLREQSLAPVYTFRGFSLLCCVFEAPVLKSLHLLNFSRAWRVLVGTYLPFSFFPSFLSPLSLPFFQTRGTGTHEYLKLISGEWNFMRGIQRGV